MCLEVVQWQKWKDRSINSNQEILEVTPAGCRSSLDPDSSYFRNQLLTMCTRWRTGWSRSRARGRPDPSRRRVKRWRSSSSRGLGSNSGRNSRWIDTPPCRLGTARAYTSSPCILFSSRSEGEIISWWSFSPWSTSCWFFCLNFNHYIRKGGKPHSQELTIRREGKGKERRIELNRVKDDRMESYF
jgi:hypothetical protein